MGSESIFEMKNYRNGIRWCFERSERLGRKIKQGELAEAIQIQRSYLSKVINGYAELSRDQMASIAYFFDLAEEESDFLLLLHDHDRTGMDWRKAELKKQIKEVRANQLKMQKHLDSEVPDFKSGFDEYFLDPYLQLIHQALDIEKFAFDPKLLAAQFNLDEVYFHELLKKLEDNGFVAFNGEKYVTYKNNWHLPRENPLFHLWLNQQRGLAQQRMAALKKDETYGFNAIFTAEPETLVEIKKEFLKFTKKIQKLAVASADERLFQIGFDILPWTGPD